MIFEQLTVFLINQRTKMLYCIIHKFIRKHSPKASLLSKSTGTDYLIISGKEDNLMPFTGSVDFYTKMKNNGEDVSILLEEGHGHETTAEDALNIGKFIM